MRALHAVVGVALAMLAATGCRDRDGETVPTIAEARAAVPAKAATRPASATAFYAHTYDKRPSVPALTALGRKLFNDPALSASGMVSCASCHDPAYAFTPPNDRALQLGGVDGKTPGTRAAPTLRYLQAAPRFTLHYHDSDGDDGVDQGPAGGLAWDGRAQTAHEQARLPLFSPLEMANRSTAELAAAIRRAPYADELRAAFGDSALATDDGALKAVLLSLEVFQQDPTTFYPYASKYDAVIRGRARLTAQEQRGLVAFNSPTAGNCARCHPSALGANGFPAFTDFGFVALGIPRNPELPAGRDLGLCGPLRTDLADHPELCGMFRTPTLRNVARKRRFGHNGVFTSLEQVVRFYATPRDLSDLPAAYRGNVDREPPFREDGKRSLTDAQIADIVAFLRTLDDQDR